MTAAEASHRLREVIRRQHKDKDVLGSPLQNADALRGARSAHLRHVSTLA